MAMKITAKGIATKSKNGKVLDVYFHFIDFNGTNIGKDIQEINTCLLYTSPSPRD